MKINETLKKFGLNGKKADVYLATLELGSGTVIEIAKKANIKRTTCYDILLELIKQGFVFEAIKGKKRLFIGEDPEKIKADLKRKEVLFDEVMPMLKSIYNIKGIKPKIRFYEGREGLKEVYEDTLRYEGEIVAFASEDIVNVLGMPWADSYLAKRIKNKISYLGIVPKTQMIVDVFHPKDREQLREVKFCSPEKYPFSIEINIYGHQKVALMSGKEEIGIIIEGKEIYSTLKSIFYLLWDSL